MGDPAGLFPTRRPVFGSVPPYDDIALTTCSDASVGPLVRLCSTSALSVCVVDVIPPEATAAFGLGWGKVFYSLVVISVPVQACQGRRNPADRLNIVFSIKKADFGSLRPRWTNYGVFLIKGALADEHDDADYEGLQPQFDRRGGFMGRLVVGPDGCLHAMTSARMRLRPLGGAARASIECRRFTPLVPRLVDAAAGAPLETFARGPDTGRMKLALFKANRAGYSKRRAAGAVERLHQLCARMFQLASPGYRAPRPPEPPYAVGDRVRLRWLARDDACRRLNGRTGRVVTPGLERSTVRLAGAADRLFSVANRNMSTIAGRPRQRGDGLFCVLSPLAEHAKNSLERRMRANTICGSNCGGNTFRRQMRLFEATPEGASLFRALDEEALKIKRHLQHRVSYRAVVDPFRYPIVRIKRVVPMPYTEAFRSVRRQAARRSKF